MTRRLTLAVPLLLLLQLALVAVGVWPQLSARAVGDEIQLRVRPVDPIDPFRGAYVALAYPDLLDGARYFDGSVGATGDGESGPVFVSLRQDGDVWVSDGWSRDRPADGTYLRCDGHGSQIRCGIGSWFLPQDEAKAMEDAVAAREVVATVKVDGRGNAALVDVSAP